MKTNDSLTLDIAEVYSSKIKKQPEVIAEGANDHESEHKSILKKLHKELPELGLDKAEHTGKVTNRDGSEVHTYTVKHDIPPTLKHTISKHETTVKIGHYDAAKTMGHFLNAGRHYTHAQVSQSLEHHDGGSSSHDIATLTSNHPSHPGKSHFRKGSTVKEI